MKRILLAATLFVALLAAQTAPAQVLCNRQSATIVGTAGDDPIVGTSGNDVIAGLGGNDNIDGFGGADLICGGDGDDQINGGDGDDQLYGGNDSDDLRGSGGNDQLFGEAGNDDLRGGSGNTGDDAGGGGSGNDQLNGGPGDDVMVAYDGTDSCDGVTGVDAADSACETVANLDGDVLFLRLYAGDGTPLDGEIYLPRGDAVGGQGTRQVAWIVRHGAQGSYVTGVPQSAGLWGIQYGFTVLALNGRDWGAAAGGGNTLFEDTTRDMGVGIDFLERLGFSKVFVAGHSGGTQAAGVYPALSNNDPRMVGVGLFGVVRDGREAATDVLFRPRASLYDPYIRECLRLVRTGQDQAVLPWQTFFGVPVFRSARTFLSYWGPDSRSVVVNEIGAAEVPVLLLRSAGDDFTPDAYSTAVRDAALTAGVDATYIEFPFRGPIGGTGVNAHIFLGNERELVGAALSWLSARVPATAQFFANVPARSSGGNVLPIADAGRAIAVTDPGTVTLDGRNSVDLDGSLVSYRWVQTAGEPVALSGAGTVRPSFAAGRKSNALAFQLTVTDNAGAVATDDVAVNVAIESVPGSGGAVDPWTLIGAALLAAWVRRRRGAAL